MEHPDSPVAGIAQDAPGRSGLVAVIYHKALVRAADTTPSALLFQQSIVGFRREVVLSSSLVGRATLLAPRTMPLSILVEGRQWQVASAGFAGLRAHEGIVKFGGNRRVNLRRLPGVRPPRFSASLSPTSVAAFWGAGGATTGGGGLGIFGLPHILYILVSGEPRRAGRVLFRFKGRRSCSEPPLTFLEH